jgi:hypothetical protein
MDLTQAQAEWSLGKYQFRSEELPELAAEMMAQGFEGPAILELVSFHRPMNRDLPPGLVDSAFRETGRPPLSKAAAARILARPIAKDVLDGRISPVDGASKILALVSCGDAGDEWFYQLDDLLECHRMGWVQQDPIVTEIVNLCAELLSAEDDPGNVPE